MTVNGNEVTKDDGPRPRRPREARRLEPGVQAQRHRHGGQLLPAQRRRRRGDVMSDEKAKELGIKPRARIITAATAGNEPE